MRQCEEIPFRDVGGTIPPGFSNSGPIAPPPALVRRSRTLPRAPSLPPLLDARRRRTARPVVNNRGRCVPGTKPSRRRVACSMKSIPTSTPRMLTV